jgi:DNA-binding transcriptional LysR family regulator
LTEHDVMSYSLMSMGDLWQFQGPQGAVSVKVRPRMWSNNGDTCLAAALQGAGIQLQPTFLIQDQLTSGQLVEILPDFRSIELDIYAVYPSRKFVLPKVRALVEFLSNKLASHAPQH